ncbi:MAG: hypothetical protein H0T46_24845 [Deltaproteobacteria bacterium]|nr:hypothetical protein [Deltaproteobacteria bacterium]
MAKNKPGSRSKTVAKPAAPTRLQNLAARPSYDDMTLGDDQLVDNSGVFRVTSSIAQAQAGHDDDTNPRFASDSLVMAAQRDGFRDDGPTLNDVVEETAVEDEATLALRRERLATLTARARARTKRR